MNPWMIVRILGIATALISIVQRERDLREKKKQRELREKQYEDGRF